MTTLPFHNIVSMAGWTDQSTIRTVSLGLAADGSTIQNYDVGKMLTWDVTAPNQMRLVTTGDVPIARLESVEANTNAGPVGAVSFRFIQKFWLLTGDAAAVGDTVQGSVGLPLASDIFPYPNQPTPSTNRGGWVKKASANDMTKNIVVEKGTDAVTGLTYVVVARCY